MRQFLQTLTICLFCVNYSYADRIIWSGDVEANGTPTSPITLTLKKKYKIKAQGTVNLGKWWQQGKPLGEDACYEFAEHITPSKFETLKNSLNISVCEGSYHPDHIYQSEPFIAKQNRIHFWIYDIDYSDNLGTLQVEIIELSDH